MASKKVYPLHYDIYGNLIDVITCKNCGHQIRREAEHWLAYYDAYVGCCEAPFYLNGIVVPDYSDERVKNEQDI